LKANVEDAFSLFDLQPRPLIDELALKEKYLRLAAIKHPDLLDGGDEQFHRLQTAYSEGVPHDELFPRVGSALQQAKGIVSRLDHTTTALGRALLSPEVATALQQIREATNSVSQAWNQSIAHLEDLDTRWPEVSAAELVAMASSFTFLSRWRSQLSEWEFRLANP
jgi:hypothetical protein